jgi:suppressor for copper-sensitivity B
MIHRPSLRAALVVALLGALSLASEPIAAQGRTPKARLELSSERSAYGPGETARLTALVVIEAGWHVNSHQPTYEWLIPTVLDLTVPPDWAPATVDYPQGVQRTFAFETEGPLSVYEGTATLVAEIEIPADAAAGPVEIAATLGYQACDDRSCLPPASASSLAAFEVRAGEAAGEAANQPVAGKPAVDASAAHQQPPVAAVAPSLVWILLLALLGGLILNAMPCVLPILSLKLFGLVRSATGGRKEVVGASLASAAGILVSFWGLAAAAVIARTAGASVGWGIQFQEPVFVTFLAVVVVLFTLNLWGLFEVPLPGFLARAGGTSREGHAGHFASGLFATLMATPCSAPFLGTAIGFALAQPPLHVFAIFTAVGTGMALPYLALAASPGAVRWLPRPGAWMDTLKGVLGFLLAGAAVWLFYILSAQISPERLAAIQLALLLLALAVWAHRRARGTSGSRVATVAILGLAIGALVIAQGGGTAEQRETAAAPARLIPWVTFDRTEAERLATEGRLVFVDVTADWCFTCKVNERLVLETEPVAGAFERHGVVAMRADWTNRNEAIASFLSDHGRYGIPFYLLYRPGAEPHLFAELLTQADVLEALEAAADSTVAQR